MNRSERRSWDRYVAEARETKSEIDLGESGVITVYIPTADQANQFQQAIQSADIWQQLAALMGEENVVKFREVAADAPITALNKLMEDILVDLGISDAPAPEPGNSSTSSG
jgi:uncharacterized protein YqeY